MWKKLARSPKFLQRKIELLPYILSNSKYKFLKSFGKKIRKISHSSIESLYNDELSRWRPDEGMYDKNLDAKSNFNQVFNYQVSDISDYRYMMFRDLITYLPSNLLVKIDRASMANSLEVRSPYLDPSLVKFVWSLPDNFLLKKILINLFFVIFCQKNSQVKFMLEKNKGLNHH